MSLHATIQRLVKLSYQVNTQLIDISKQYSKNEDIVHELLHSNMIVQLNQVSNLYDIVGELIGQIQEQTEDVGED